MRLPIMTPSDMQRRDGGQGKTRPGGQMCNATFERRAREEKRGSKGAHSSTAHPLC